MTSGSLAYQIKVTLNGIRPAVWRRLLGMQPVNERSVLLSDVLGKEKDAMVYEYDFGDGWEHKIVLEKTLESTDHRDTAYCVAGARSCPPEDCDGVPEYAHLLQIVSDVSHSEYREMLEWLGEGFDPERFDAVEINTILAKMKGRRLTVRRTRGSARAPHHGRSAS